MRDAAWPMEPPIFSIRTRENTARLSHPGFDVYQVRLGRWTRAQMRHFCARRLGRRAIAFWRQLIRQPGMLELSSLPINLSAQCELYASSGGRIAASQAELFTALIRSRIEREFNGGRLDAAGLLDDEDRLVLNCGLRTAGGLPRLPDSGLLVKWLDSLAEQFRARACVRAERAVVDAVIKGKARREAWIRAVQGLGIAGIAAEDARFAWAHQLFLEYFQARALTRSRRTRQTLVPAPLTPEPLDDVVARLQADEMLPGVGASRSDEAFRLAVELADDPESWITRAETDNLLLAARAAASCMRRISVPTRRRLKTQLLARSRNPMVDVRERIEAAALIGALGGDDLRYEVMRSSGVPSMVPNEKHWIRTPAGPYSIGGGPGEDEGPAVEVTLPEFELAFAPVTCGEFARFIEAGGYDNPQWFPGDYAQRWWRGEVRNEEAIAFWLPRLKALAADFDRAVEQYFAGEPQGYIEELRPYSKWSAEELAYQIEYRFGARKVRFPGRWQDPLLTQPLLPVTSICVIEARAYCLWLSRQTGWRIELPTEAMWEVAARGGTARPYPWDPSIEPVGRWHLNADPAHLRRNAPVGAFPAADTPSGLADMAGNVVQWTSSAYTPRLDAGVACAALADDDVRRTARGGDWSETVERCRATARFAQPAALRAPRLGFRIARIGP